MPLKRWVAAAVVAVLACPAVAATGAAFAAPAKARGPVVLFAVPDLRWTDLAAMPTLRRLAGRGAVGVLSVRSQGESTRCGDGLLELSAGTRVPSGLVSCAIDAATLDRVRAGYRHGRYDARVGLLGDHVNGTTAAVGAGAPAVVAASTGPAPPVTSLRQALAAGASVVVIVDTQLYDDPNRAAAAASVDQRLA
ncbi:MAG TPA: hypothetical protein VKJ07_02420, partial [Mycobacteriales bacterium]|nr:hypothetical protein [Mycobacteriales bacterium]